MALNPYFRQCLIYSRNPRDNEARLDNSIPIRVYKNEITVDIKITHKRHFEFHCSVNGNTDSDICKFSGEGDGLLTEGYYRINLSDISDGQDNILSIEAIDVQDSTIRSNKEFAITKDIIASYRTDERLSLLAFSFKQEKLLIDNYNRNFRDVLTDYLKGGKTEKHKKGRFNIFGERTEVDRNAFFYNVIEPSEPKKALKYIEDSRLSVRCFLLGKIEGVVYKTKEKGEKKEGIHIVFKVNNTDTSNPIRGLKELYIDNYLENERTVSIPAEKLTDKFYQEFPLEEGIIKEYDEINDEITTEKIKENIKKGIKLIACNVLDNTITGRAFILEGMAKAKLYEKRDIRHQQLLVTE